MKIGLVGEFYSKNLGEPLLFECTRHLCKKNSEDKIEFKYIDFFGRSFSGDNSVWFDKDRTFFVFILKSIRKVIKCMGKNQKTLWLDEKIWALGRERKRLARYFADSIKGLDGIIIMGAGTIKYDVRLNFAPYYKELMQEAEKQNIPVFINCAGIESKYNAKDRRCRMFCDVLSMDILKIATTRDDIETLKQMIHNKKTEVAKIADIGVWSSETFDISREKSDTIGLGIITPERFVEFHRNITPKQYEEEWLQIIKTLDLQGKKWEIFNNGDDCDREYAEALCLKAGYSPEQKVKTPTTPEELVKVISSYQGIVTSRLHSCIVAYSLGIPFVAIIWNNKLQYFAENIGYRNRIIDSEDFNSQEVLKKFEEAITVGYNEKEREEYRATSIVYIKKYIEYIKSNMEGKDK